MLLIQSVQEAGRSPACVTLATCLRTAHRLGARTYTHPYTYLHTHPRNLFRSSLLSSVLFERFYLGNFAAV